MPSLKFQILLTGEQMVNFFATVSHSLRSEDTKNFPRVDAYVFVQFLYQRMFNFSSPRMLLSHSSPPNKLGWMRQSEALLLKSWTQTQHSQVSRFSLNILDVPQRYLEIRFALCVHPVQSFNIHFKGKELNVFVQNCCNNHSVGFICEI